MARIISASAFTRSFSSFEAFSFFSISAKKAKASLPSNTGVASIGFAIILSPFRNFQLQKYTFSETPHRKRLFSAASSLSRCSKRLETIAFLSLFRNEKIIQHNRHVIPITEQGLFLADRPHRKTLAAIIAAPIAAG